MKAKMKMALPGFTGTMDGISIYYNSKLNQYIARRTVKPSHVPDSSDMKLLFAFADRIVLSDEWKDDCNRYINAYNTKNRKRNKALSSWSSVWMKLMKAQFKARPDLDFTTITREEIAAQEIPCRSISTAVEAGFLDTVPSYQKLTNHI